MSGQRSRPHWVLWSGLSSATHLIHGKAWLRQLRTLTDAEITVVLAEMRPFLGVQQLTFEEAVEQLKDLPGVTVRNLNDSGLQVPKGNVGHYLAVGAPGIKAWLKLRLKNPINSLETVVTDEGLSSYGNWRTRRDAWLREGGREPWTTARAVATAAARRLLASSRWAMLRRDGALWVVNPWIRAEFLSSGTRDQVSNVAVFCSQPWVEMGLLTAAEYTSFVLTVADRCQAEGFDFVLRPHPVEQTERYLPEVEVSTDPRPAELDPACINAAFLLGASSTAMINLAAIHNVPVIRVSPPAVAALDDRLSAGQADLIAAQLGRQISIDDLGVELRRHRDSH